MKHATDSHGAPRILRYDDYLNEARRAMGDGTPAQVERLHQDLLEAQRRYSDSLRAFPSSYYATIAQPAHREAIASAAAVQAAPAVDELTDHNYDGIEEYDNPTPGWWWAIFAGSVVFSLLYVMVYHTLVPPLPERHASAKAAALDKQFAELNTLPMGEEKILTIMGEDAWLAHGAAVYMGSCSICHGADGAGLVGPNLTDEYYKNVTSLIEIADLVVTGTANGAMPAQKNLLNENEIALVSAYVASLRGQNLPTNPAVSPDYLGVEIAPWPDPDGDPFAVQP